MFTLGRKGKYVNIDYLHYLQKRKYINIKYLHSHNILHIETQRIKLHLITFHPLFYN